VQLLHAGPISRSIVAAEVLRHLPVRFIGCTINAVRIEFDPAKRDLTLAMRGLDFARAHEIFAGHHFTARDERINYGEDRMITVGKLDGRMVVMVWTARGAVRRIISLRKANAREQARYAQKLG
jgi:uncharacterized DUF497 family protein